VKGVAAAVYEAAAHEWGVRSVSAGHSAGPEKGGGALANSDLGDRQ